MLNSLDALLKSPSLAESSDSSSESSPPRHPLRLSTEDAAMHPYFELRRRSQTFPSETRISLKPYYFNERLAEEFSQKHYLDPSEREHFRIQTADGIFRDQYGWPSNTSMLYVLFLNNHLYACYPSTGLHHSYLSMGFDVKAAGNMFFYQGKVITISNESGHYRPTFSEMQNGLKWFLIESQQPSILFEDHSHQDQTEVLNGIRFFKVTIDHNGNILHEQLSGVALVDYLKTRIESMPASSASLPFQPPSITLFDSSSESDGYSFDEYEQGPPLSFSCSAAPSIDTRHPILAHPELASLTCIKDYYIRQDRNQVQSRYWGVKNIHRRPRSNTL